MHQLNPSETITVNRILKDPTDTGTYYVQAVVYNSDTRAVLQTLNLTDHGNRWFSATYKVPWDNTFANGRRILIVTSVYTDAGYTTFSPNYAQESEEYLVQQRWSQGIYTSAGTALPVDYKEMRKILKEELATMPVNELEPLELPTLDEEKLAETLASKVAEHVGAISQKIDNLPQPKEQPPLDLNAAFSPLQSYLEKKLSALERTVNSIPQPEQADFSDIRQEMKDLRLAMAEMRLAAHSSNVGQQHKLEISLSDNQDAKKQAYLENLKRKYV